jgi:hypothetical protein
MWSLLFRTKAGLDKALAVERCRRELAEAEAHDLRARLEQIELQHARLLDQVLQKQGTITTPLRTKPAPPPHPLVGALAALSMTEYDGKNPNGAASSSPDSWPPMPDE